MSGNSRSTAQLPASSAGSVLGRGWDRTSVWGPLGSGATSCSVGGLGQVTKAQDSAIGGNRDPRLSEERKLKTKCFFLKSRKEAATVEFHNGERG